MLDIDSTTDLKELLKASIQLLKQQKSNLSSSAIASNLGIASSTFGRIENGEVRRPDFRHTLSILKAAYDEDTAMKGMTKFYPEVTQNFEKVYPGNKDVPFIDTDSEKYFKDPTSYELMVMATSEAGISRDQVKCEFGNKGLGILNELLAQGVLMDNDGIIGIKGNINATQPTVHKLVQNLIAQNYDIGAFGNKANWLSLQYDSVNLEIALPKVREIMQKASGEIRAVLNDPAYKGKDVLWASMASDSLMKQTPQKEVLQ